MLLYLAGFTTSQSHSLLQNTATRTGGVMCFVIITRICSSLTKFKEEKGNVLQNEADDCKTQVLLQNKMQIYYTCQGLLQFGVYIVMSSKCKW